MELFKSYIENLERDKPSSSFLSILEKHLNSNKWLAENINNLLKLLHEYHSFHSDNTWEVLLKTSKAFRRITLDSVELKNKFGPFSGKQLVKVSGIPEEDKLKIRNYEGNVSVTIEQALDLLEFPKIDTEWDQSPANKIIYLALPLKDYLKKSYNYDEPFFDIHVFLRQLSNGVMHLNNKISNMKEIGFDINYFYSLSLNGLELDDFWYMWLDPVLQKNKFEPLEESEALKLVYDFFKELYEIRNKL